MPVGIFVIIDRFPFVAVPRRTNIDLVIDPDAVAPPSEVGETAR